MGVVGLQLIDLLLLEANVHEANMRRLISLNVRSVVPSGALTMPRSVLVPTLGSSAYTTAATIHLSMPSKVSEYMYGYACLRSHCRCTKQACYSASMIRIVYLTRAMFVKDTRVL